MLSRSVFIASFLYCVTLLGAAAYLQYVEKLVPCPMCIMQRWILIILSLWTVVAFWHNPSVTGRRMYGLGMLLLATIGAILAGRQVWLQHLPPAAVPECGPGFDFLLTNFPLTEALGYIFAGSGECAVVDWTFLGQSLAVWSMGAFILLALVGLLCCLVGNGKKFKASSIE